MGYCFSKVILSILVMIKIQNGVRVTDMDFIRQISLDKLPSFIKVLVGILVLQGQPLLFDKVFK